MRRRAQACLLNTHRRVKNIITLMVTRPQRGRRTAGQVLQGHTRTTGHIRLDRTERDRRQYAFACLAFEGLLTSCIILRVQNSDPVSSHPCPRHGHCRRVQPGDARPLSLLRRAHPGARIWIRHLAFVHAAHGRRIDCVCRARRWPRRTLV